MKEEIIEYQGRKFVRTGIRRTRVEVGEWYMGESAYRQPIQCKRDAGDFGSEGREILRELPAEPAAPAGESPQGAAPSQTPRCPRCRGELHSVIAHVPQKSGTCLAGIGCSNPECLHLFEIRTIFDLRQFYFSAPPAPTLTGEQLKSIAMKHCTVVAGYEFAERFDFDAIAKELNVAPPADTKELAGRAAKRIFDAEWTRQCADEDHLSLKELAAIIEEELKAMNNQILKWSGAVAVALLGAWIAAKIAIIVWLYLVFGK